MFLLSLRQRQILVFGISWVAYASTYLLRKPLGVIKADLETELSFTKNQLGWLDTALLMPYALMQMLLGPLGDRFGPRKTFSVCLILAGLSMASFGLWDNYYVFAALLFINGTAQSQCWPSCGKALTAWFSDKVRNSVFGVFGTCAFVGGIVGTGLSVYLQSEHGWRSVYLLPSVLVAVLGCLVFGLYSQPEEVGMEVPGREEQTKPTEVPPRLSFLQLWKIPAVPEIAVAMFCLKIVRYCMYMWLPMYLLHHLKYAKTMAGIFSTMFEIGGVIGCAGIGLVIDKCFQGKAFVGTMVSILLSALSLLLFYLTAHWGIVFNSTCMILAGAFNSGPDVILGGSLPAELGEQGGRKSAAAVVGLVNGFGSMGTFMEGPIVGMVTSVWGWAYMFHLLFLLSLVGAVSVYKAAIGYLNQQELAQRTKEDLIMA